MTTVRRLVLVPSLAMCLSACPAGDDGTALLGNETGSEGVRVVVRDGAGRAFTDQALDPWFRFDTQFTNRERQCLVGGDGSFEVRDAAGVVLVEHDFSDRPVCEHDVLTVTADLELVWGE